MITRIWHGVTARSNAEKYLKFLLTQGTKEYTNIPGNLSVRVWKQEEETVCHFWTVSEWENIEAVKAFAGEEYEKAKYYKEDYGVLLQFEEKVEHHESYVVR